MRRSTRNESLWKPFGLAVGFHMLMAAMVVLSTLSWKPFKQSKAVALTIQAVIVDTTQLATRRDEAQKEAEQAQKRQQLEDRRAEELNQQKQREREQEVQRQKQAETEKLKLAETEKQKQAQAEQARIKKLDEEARKKKEAQDKLTELRKEQEKKNEEDRLKQQQELDKVRQQQAEAEKQRKVEAEKLKQLEAREKAQEQEKLMQQEQARQQQLQEDAIRAQQDRQAQSEAEGRIADLGDRYQLAVQQLVRENWLRPPTAKPGLRCILRIVQIPGGEVISAAISGSCNGDEATRRSIVAAVERIDALPYRGFEEVFAREIDFEFKYDGE